MHSLQRFIARPAWLVNVFVLALLFGAFALGPFGDPVYAQGPEPLSPDLALGTGFTYQGHLQKNGSPVNGACSLTFSLWDSQGSGTQIGSSQPINPVSIVNGDFTVVLNGANQFGAFSGQARWLQTAVQCAGDGSPVTLSRLQITAVPQAAFSAAPWSTNGSDISYLLGNVGIGTSSPGRSLHVSSPNSGLRLQSSSSSAWTTTEYQTDARLWHTGVGGSTVGNDVKSKYYIADGTASQFRLVVDTSGNVGIGTTAPSAMLSVVKAGAPEPSVQGAPTGLKVGTPAGTFPLAIRQNAPKSGTPGLVFFETSDGDLGGIGANPRGMVINSALGQDLTLLTNGSTHGLTIDNQGNVSVGTTTPSAQFTVRYKTAGVTPFRVDYLDGTASLKVEESGYVSVRLLGPTGAGHVCALSGTLTQCASAAEYVPSIDGGSGYPSTADLVSVVSNADNPYGDHHSPFVVEKSSTACDPNLLGYIVKPESEADGPKLNEHYLPLAIYGYFPAKVTLQNGPVRRGDALTSSSRPGYAMKASEACKIIGYALEDAQDDGAIQVFAHLSENAAPEVATLRAQVDELKKQNDALAARLDAIEKRYTALPAPGE